MVANAGIFLFKPLLDTSVDEWERMLAINGKGVFLSIKYAAKQMIEQGRGGRIICTLRAVVPEAQRNDVLTDIRRRGFHRWPQRCVVGHSHDCGCS